MPSHNPYQYSPADTPRIINWAKIILWGIGIGILISIFIFLILNPLNLFSEKANDLLNNSNGNQGIAVGEPNPNGYDCSADVYNCGNFTTQSEAQYVFDLCGPGDIHQLDGDGNGKACESLPQ